MILSKSELAAIRKRAMNERRARAKNQLPMQAYLRDIPALIDTIEAFAQALEEMESHARTVIVRHHSGKMQCCGDNTKAILKAGELTRSYHASPTEGGTE